MGCNRLFGWVATLSFDRLQFPIWMGNNPLFARATTACWDGLLPPL